MKGREIQVKSELDSARHMVIRMGRPRNNHITSNTKYRFG